MEVEILINESKTETFRFHEAIYSRGVLASDLGSLWIAFEEANLQVTEDLRVEVALQTIVVLLKTHVISDVVGSYFGLVCVTKKLVAAAINVKISSLFNSHTLSLSIFFCRAVVL